MIATTDITLIKLLEHKQIMFDLIDYSDALSTKGADEFSVSHYYYLVESTLKKLGDNERRRLSEIMSLEHLERCNLLACWDRHAGIFIFQPFVLSMFRHLESSRLKELSDAELNGLHARIREIYLDVCNPDSKFPWFRGDIEYTERFGHIITTLRDLNARIEQNVLSLKGQSKILSEIAESEINSSSLRAEQVYSALKKIFELVERYIHPTLSFLNPDLDWKGQSNAAPLYYFEQIMQRFENRGFLHERTMMSRIYQNLISASEDIALVRNTLDVYLILYEDQRRLYNSIEEKYNAFYAQVKELHDGKLRGNKLDPKNAVVGQMAIIQGLKSHISAQYALMNLPESHGTLFLDEHLRIRLPKIQESKHKLTTVDSSNPKDLVDIKHRSRFNKLYKLSTQLVLIPDRDIYDSIHHLLSQSLDDYTLADVIDVYSMIVQDKLETRLDLSAPKTIYCNGKTLTYFKRTWTGNRIDT